MNFSFFINFLVTASFLVATNLCGLRALCCEDTSKTHTHEEGDNSHDHRHAHDKESGGTPEHHKQSQDTCCTSFSAVSSVGIQTNVSKNLINIEFAKSKIIFPQVIDLKGEYLGEIISGVDPPNQKFLSLLSSLHRAPNAPPIASVHHALSL